MYNLPELHTMAQAMKRARFFANFAFRQDRKLEGKSHVSARQESAMVYSRC